MNLFRRIKSRVSLFFQVDLPLFWGERSLFSKISLGCLGVILAHILFYLCIIGFIYLMTVIHGSKTYELLYPAEEVASVEIIYVNESVNLYFYAIDDIPEILDQRTVPVVSPEDIVSPECMDDLLALSASQWWNDPCPSIAGGTLLITYKNGSREWVCGHGTFQYDAPSGEAYLTWYYFSDEEFSSFLEAYGYKEND